MELVAKLDDMGKPAWIALMILGFVLFWPFGLAVLAYLIWSGRMGCWKRNRLKRWEAEGRGWFEGRFAPPSSGNRAFDEYRAETLRRLEEEQKEFTDFLERLRFAKDKAEFDQFMAERRRRGDGPQPEPQPQA